MDDAQGALQGIETRPIDTKRELQTEAAPGRLAAARADEMGRARPELHSAVARSTNVRHCAWAAARHCSSRCGSTASPTGILSAIACVESHAPAPTAASAAAPAAVASTAPR